jgi:hypothetical protein
MDKVCYLSGCRVLTVMQEPVTYVAGEWSTFNKAVKDMETFHGQKSKFLGDAWACD